MESFSTAFFGILAAAWIIGGLRVARGMARVPRLGEVSPLPDADCPAISILVPARNEAARLPQALPTLLAQDYPRYEVIVVNDRSCDATGEILGQFASQHQNLRVHHLTELPAGWLGKPHALEVGYQHATGEWLVFTDADVRFAPDLLRRAVALAREKGWEHLTLLLMADLEGFWEKTAVSFWGMGLVFGTEAWRVSNPRSRRYLGVGAFQLLRRSAYEAIGTHRRLALEVVDDIKLGKLVKLIGLRSGVALAGERLRLRWQEGLLNLIRGLTKEFLCRLRFSRSHCRGASLAGLRLQLPAVSRFAVYFGDAASAGDRFCRRRHCCARQSKPLLQGFAVLWLHAPPRRVGDVLHSAPFGDCHPVARRGGVARHLLPA